jgi:hypothetical protein
MPGRLSLHPLGNFRSFLEVPGRGGHRAPHQEGGAAPCGLLQLLAVVALRHRAGELLRKFVSFIVARPVRESPLVSRCPPGAVRHDFPRGRVASMVNLEAVNFLPQVRVEIPRRAPCSGNTRRGRLNDRLAVSAVDG